MKLRFRDAESNTKFKGTIAIIGAGWYGTHWAIRLAKYGYKIVLYEQEATPFMGISGKFGIRNHNGMHHPRSSCSRLDCRLTQGFMKQHYPELLFSTKHAIYSLGREDAAGNSSKVDKNTFHDICMLEGHNDCKGKIDLQAQDNFSDTELLTAYDTTECSIYVGQYHKNFFLEKISSNSNITFIGETKVNSVERLSDEKFQLSFFNKKKDSGCAQFDEVLNATGFKSLVTRFPLGVKIVYQPLVALKYRNKWHEDAESISFIVMDGLFPCLLPYKSKKDVSGEYIVTHAKWTTISSCDSADEANQILKEINDDFIIKHVKHHVQADMKRFWPKFSDRFEYIGWVSEVLAKPCTNTEFRSSCVYRDPSGVCFVLPGKVSHVESAFQEVSNLIGLNDSKVIITDNEGYQYVKGGSIHRAQGELEQAIVNENQNTSFLQTYRHLFRFLSD